MSNDEPWIRRIDRILQKAKKRGSGLRGCLNDKQMRSMAGQPAKSPNPLDHYRPIELCRWCEAPEVNDAVTALAFEVVGTNALFHLRTL